MEEKEKKPGQQLREALERQARALFEQILCKEE